jgi:hypothetical protein
MGQRMLGGALDGGCDAKQLVRGPVADRFGGVTGGSAFGQGAGLVDDEVSTFSIARALRRS